MKKQNIKKEVINSSGYDESVYNNDSIVSNTPKDLDVVIDDKTYNEIFNALNPDVITTPPKGYYSSRQLEKIMKMAHVSITRRIKKLKTENKIKTILVWSLINGKHYKIPYYKFNITS